MSAMVSVSYPDYDQPLGANNTVNLQTLGQGYHYLTGQSTGTTVSHNGPPTIRLTLSTFPSCGWTTQSRSGHRIRCR